MTGFRLILLLFLVSCTQPLKKKIIEGEILFFTLPITLEDTRKVQFWKSLNEFLSQNPSFQNQYQIPDIFVDLDNYMLLQYDFSLRNYYTKKIVYKAHELHIFLYTSSIPQTIAQPKNHILLQKVEFHKIIFYQNDKPIFTTNISSL